MASFLLIRLLFWAVSTLANLVSLAVFKAAAGLVVLAVQAVKVPAGAFDRGLEHAGGLVRSCVEHLVELLMDALLSLASGAFELAAGAASGSVGLAASAVGELAEKARAAAEGLSEIFPEAVEEFKEMLGKVVGDLWSNYKDAVQYVVKNVRQD